MTVVLESPRSVEELKAIKGFSPRLAQTKGPDLLAGILAVAQLEEGELTPYPRGNRNGPGRFSPEEEVVAEEVRNLRAEKAKELGLEKGVVLSNAQITEIIRAAPRSVEALEGMPVLRKWQTGLLGAEIIRALRRTGGPASN
jgi:ribonuclease D